MRGPLNRRHLKCPMKVGPVSQKGLSHFKVTFSPKLRCLQPSRHRKRRPARHHDLCSWREHVHTVSSHNFNSQNVLNMVFFVFACFLFILTIVIRQIPNWRSQISELSPIFTSKCPLKAQVAQGLRRGRFSGLSFSKLAVASPSFTQWFTSPPGTIL